MPTDNEYLRRIAEAGGPGGGGGATPAQIQTAIESASNLSDVSSWLDSINQTLSLLQSESLSQASATAAIFAGTQPLEDLLNQIYSYLTTDLPDQIAAAGAAGAAASVDEWDTLPYERHAPGSDLVTTGSVNGGSAEVTAPADTILRIYAASVTLANSSSDSYAPHAFMRTGQIMVGMGQFFTNATRSIVFMSEPIPPTYAPSAQLNFCPFFVPIILHPSEAQTRRLQFSVRWEGATPAPSNPNQSLVLDWVLLKQKPVA